MVIGNSGAADKNCSVPPKRKGNFVTLTYARSLNGTLLQSNYTLICFLIKLLNMTSQFGPILSSILGRKNSNVGIILVPHIKQQHKRSIFLEKKKKRLLHR